MNNELRECFKKVYEEAAEKCCACKHKCFIYVFVNYINDNSYEYFIYQLEHESLPIEVKIAYDKLIKLIGKDSLVKGSINKVFIYC